MELSGGFINKIADLSAYTENFDLDGFVVEGRTYLLIVVQEVSSILEDSQC